MITKIDKETLDFLCEKSLTFNQFAICLLIYHKDVAKIIQYTEEVGYMGTATIVTKDGFSVMEIEDLLQRGFLLSHGLDKKEPWALDNFIVTEKFTKGFLIGTEDVFSELWQEYPKHILINNEEKPTKVADYETLEEKYLKAIGYNLKKHQEVMRKLKLYKSSHQYAQMNLANFIGSKHWTELTDGHQPKSRIY